MFKVNNKDTITMSLTLVSQEPYSVSYATGHQFSEV